MKFLIISIILIFHAIAWSASDEINSDTNNADLQPPDSIQKETASDSDDTISSDDKDEVEKNIAADSKNTIINEEKISGLIKKTNQDETKKNGSSCNRAIFAVH